MTHIAKHIDAMTAWTLPLRTFGAPVQIADSFEYGVDSNHITRSPEI